MIDKRLIGTVADSKKYIAGNVISQWISLAANICMMGAIAQMLQHLYEGAIGERQIALTAFSMCCCFSKNGVSFIQRGKENASTDDL